MLFFLAGKCKLNTCNWQISGGTVSYEIIEGRAHAPTVIHMILHSLFSNLTTSVMGFGSHVPPLLCHCSRLRKTDIY